MQIVMPEDPLGEADMHQLLHNMYLQQQTLTGMEQLPMLLIQSTSTTKAVVGLPLFCALAKGEKHNQQQMIG